MTLEKGPIGNSQPESPSGWLVVFKQICCHFDQISRFGAFVLLFGYYRQGDEQNKSQSQTISWAILYRKYAKVSALLHDETTSDHPQPLVLVGHSAHLRIRERDD